MTTQPWPVTGPVAPAGEPAPRRLSTAETVLLGLALLWSVLVAVGAFVVPLGAGISGDGTGVTTALPNPTVAEQSGLAAGACLVPLLVTIVVSALLARRGAGVPSLVAAWLALGVLGLTILVGILSIGIFLLPAAVCLFAALVVRLSRMTSRPTAAAPLAPSPAGPRHGRGGAPATAAPPPA